MITHAGFYLAAIPAVTLMGLSKGGFAGIGMLGLPLMALAIPPVQAARDHLAHSAGAGTLLASAVYRLIGTHQTSPSWCPEL